MKKTSKNQESTHQLTFYLTGLAGAAALTGTSQGAIVAFIDSGSFYQGLVSTPDVPTLNITLPDTSVLNLDPGSDGKYLDLSFNKTGYSFGSDGRFTGSGSFHSIYAGISLLHLGDAISANNAGSYPGFGMVVYNTVPQPGFTGNVSGYLGFVTPLGNKGWLAVSYNSANGLFTWDGGAVETAGGSLTAGQLTLAPEPSSAALLAFGAIGMLRRRRKAA